MGIQAFPLRLWIWQQEKAQINRIRIPISIPLQATLLLLENAYSQNKICLIGTPTTSTKFTITSHNSLETNTGAQMLLLEHLMIWCKLLLDQKERRKKSCDWKITWTTFSMQIMRNRFRTRLWNSAKSSLLRWANWAWASKFLSLALRPRQKRKQ